MKFRPVAYLILTLSLSLSAAEIPREDISDILVDHYLQAFNIEMEQLNLRIAHYPDTRRLPEGKYEIAVEADGRNARLGYRSLRLLFMQNGLVVRKYPVTVDVSVYLDVCVTRSDVSRDQEVSEENAAIERVLLKRNPDDVITDMEEIIKLNYARSLSSGSIIRQNNLKKPADVYNGDKVTILLRKGPLQLSAEGRVLEEASVGGRVTVYVDQSAVKKKGILLAPGLVQVEM